MLFRSVAVAVLVLVGDKAEREQNLFEMGFGPSCYVALRWGGTLEGGEADRCDSLADL